MNNIWQPICDPKIKTELDILYCGLSKDDGLDTRDSDSISHQKEILANFAAKNGFVRSIICKNKDRFGRDYLRVGLYMEMFKERGIRFIAIGDGVDNIRDDDSAPFRDIIAEFYARDTSKKIKAVLHSKGHSGKPLTNQAIYGYRKNPDDHNHWIMDETAAPIVQRIFRMTVDGKGPYQIARQFCDERIIRPSCHIARLSGCATAKTKQNPYKWTDATITHIIRAPEYIP
jgi:DNA invertase Pin-like site-specific DNA recombinase